MNKEEGTVKISPKKHLHDLNLKCENDHVIKPWADEMKTINIEKLRVFLQKRKRDIECKIGKGSDPSLENKNLNIQYSIP